MKKMRYGLFAVISIYVIAYVSVVHFLDLDKIQRIPQSTVILDRNGGELFRFFDEDRRWVGYDQISSRMKKAIVAIEDERFRTNDGTDVQSLLRALLNNFNTLRSNDIQIQGGSTITQQIVKNIFLTKKKTIKRKLQELFLAKWLTKELQATYIRKLHVDKQIALMRAKEQILSVYLNYVYYGNHAYGIDAAARQYFHTTPAELSLVQSVLLAGMPQAPSIYNPVEQSQNLLGYWKIPFMGLEHTITTWEEVADMLKPYHLATHTMLTIQHPLVSGYISLLEQKPLDISGSCLDTLYTWATGTGQYRDREYVLGRKDAVLCRMREQGMISSQQLKNTFLSMQGVTFYKAKFPLQAPHFVFWIKDLLLKLPEFADRDFTEQQLSQAGYTIRTTLDSTKQKLAQEANENFMGMLRKLGGSNRAMIHVDSRNGDVLSYVGSVDYYDEATEGQVDMLRARRQIGSVIKPFFYAYLFTHYPFDIDGSIVDGPVGVDGPGNHDKQFRGKISLADALAGSRNLPAVRMFLALGKEQTFVPHLQQLGFPNLDVTKQYGYPLVLGAVETPLINLAQAYIQLSVVGDAYPQIDPILRIQDNEGHTVYEKHPKIQTKIIPDTVADMIWRILSNPSYMPTAWKRLHSFPINNIALKTGTTDKKIGKQSFPRDGLSVLYTPQDVIVSRAGNTNGTAMGPKAFGGEINHYTLKQYITNLHEKNLIDDLPRVSETYYGSGGIYSGVDHLEELTEEQKLLLRKF